VSVADRLACARPSRCDGTRPRVRARAARAGLAGGATTTAVRRSRVPAADVVGAMRATGDEAGIEEAGTA
jgi:hypothetical protein